MGRAVISALCRGCVTLGVRRMGSRIRAPSERPDWRVSSLASLGYHSARLRTEEPGLGALDATSSASRFGHGPQRVFLDRRPPPTPPSKDGSEFVTNLCVFVFLTPLWDALLSILLTHSRLPGTTVRFRIKGFSWLALLTDFIRLLDGLSIFCYRTCLLCQIRLSFLTDELPEQVCLSPPLPSGRVGQSLGTARSRVCTP